MRLPSSSSLILASLAVSSSSSSLSALAAPTGDGSEVSSPAAVLHGSDDTMAQPNDHLQSRNLVDPLIGPLLPPGFGKPTDIVHKILEPLIGNDAPKPREESLEVVNHLTPAGKTTRAEGTDESRVDGGPKGSSLQPCASQLKAPAPAPAAGRQDATVAPANPPAGCPSLPSPPSGPIRRQEAGNGQAQVSGGNSVKPPSPPVHLPLPPKSNAPPSESNGSGQGADAKEPEGNTLPAPHRT